MPEPAANPYYNGALRARTGSRYPGILVTHHEPDERLAVVETMAKQELSRLGVLGVAYYGYLDFVRECWEERCRCRGNSLNVEIATVIRKWEELRFDEKVLLRLRDYVLAVSPR